MNKSISIKNKKNQLLFSKISVFLTLLIIIISNASCDNVDFFSFAEETANYGIKWTPAGNIPSGNIITITFPEDAVNADLTTNYSVNYSGAGSVTIDFVVYDSATRTASLNLLVTSTDGSYFYIEIIPSAMPITMEHYKTDGVKSPSYKTPGVLSVVSWSPAASTMISSIVEVVFSENVSNADNISNYTVNYSGTGSVTINSAIYDGGTLRATLFITPGGTDGSLVSFGITASGSPITNGISTITGVSSPSFFTPDLAQPQILAWAPFGGTIPSTNFTVTIMFSENVVNANSLGNYSLSGGVTGMITSVAYNPGTFTTTLDVTVSGPVSTNFTININNANIFDTNSNMLMTPAPPTFLSLP